MPRSRPSDLATLGVALAAALIVTGRPRPAQAQNIDVPESVVQMGECYNRLEASLKFSTGNRRLVPLLPDNAATQTLIGQARHAGTVRPATAPDVPPPARVEGLQGLALRTALAPGDAAFSDHRLHLIRLRAQAAVLDEGRASADRIAALVPAQRAALETGLWPNWRDTTVLDAGDGACAGSYMQGVVANGRTLARQRFAAFGFGEDLRVIEGLFGPPGGAVRVEVPAWALPTCNQGNVLVFACRADRRFVVRPFYLGDEAAQTRQKADLTPEDLQAVQAAAANAALAFDAARARFTAAFDRDGAAIAEATARRHAQLKAERDGLTAWKAAVDAEQAVVRVLAQLIETLTALLAANDQELAGLDAAEARAMAEAEAARALEDDLRVRLQAARERVSQTRRDRDALRLECAGADYAACTDEAARLRYDEALYNLYSALTDAEDAEWALSDRLDAAVDARFTAQDRIADLGFRRLELRADAAEQRVELVGVRAEEGARRTAVDREAADWSLADDGNRRAAGTVADLMAMIG